MIVVLPDSKTIYNSLPCIPSSATTGDFENYVARDVGVAYIDAHYRTIPNRQSRGLVGHSMGGYGASRIGMKHPDVFGALYIMSTLLPLFHGWRRICRNRGSNQRNGRLPRRGKSSRRPNLQATSQRRRQRFQSAQYATAAALGSRSQEPGRYLLRSAAD